MDIIPFFSYSMAAFLALVSLCLQPGGSVPRAEQRTGVSYQLLYRLLAIFREYQERLMLLLRREGLWDAAPQPLLRQLISLICRQPPPWAQSAFFRDFRSPLFLHRHNAGAFPLSFGASGLRPCPPT